MSRRQSGRLFESIIAAIAVSYLLLLVPTSSIPDPEAGARDPFIWNRDDYFSSLESSFLKARSADPKTLLSSIDNRFVEFEGSIHSLRTRALEPSDLFLDSLETELFELAPLIAAAPEKISKFMGLHNAVRMAIKDQSRRWDMNAKEVRHRVYRLLYGGRAAVEETMLQSPQGTYPDLVLSNDIPSGTPAAIIRGAEVRSGDILVSRGGAPTSALIARGNDYPGNFSHVALVYVDESTGETSIIESHIEIGVTVSTVERYLADTKLRIMILRMRADLPVILCDPMLPHRAAEAIYRRAADEHIPYDFEMDNDDPSKLFCSEVASTAYRMFGVTLWAGVSNISSAGVRAWLAAFGVRNFETREPSDLEYDPQLAVVAEWRDPETLYKDHLDNVVIDAMLEGAEKGERLKYDWYKLPIGRIAKLYSLVLNKFEKAGPVPEGMSVESALTNDRFSKTHARIKKRTITLADKFEKDKGYKPPYWELLRLARVARGEVM